MVRWETLRKRKGGMRVYNRDFVSGSRGGLPKQRTSSSRGPGRWLYRMNRGEPGGGQPAQQRGPHAVGKNLCWSNWKARVLAKFWCKERALFCGLLPFFASTHHSKASICTWTVGCPRLLSFSLSLLLSPPLFSDLLFSSHPPFLLQN